jgi:hypothetical protein
MESVQFCGTTCHVMTPEFADYQDSTIAPGPFIRQSNRIVSFPRPNLRTMPLAADWGRRSLRVIPHFKDDESNTPSHTVLAMMISGAEDSGIHGSHFGPGVRIRYTAADAKRQPIPWVEYRNEKTGESRTYVGAESQAADAARRFRPRCRLRRSAWNCSKPIIRTRRTLLRRSPPGFGVITALYTRACSRSRVLRLRNPQQPCPRSTPETFFPDLKVIWGTYPNNLGHTDTPGCFRCHDGSHVTGKGGRYHAGLRSCHEMLAVEEESPEILKTLNLTGKIGQLQRR